MTKWTIVFEGRQAYLSYCAKALSGYFNCDEKITKLSIPAPFWSLKSRIPHDLVIFNNRRPGRFQRKYPRQLFL